MGDVLYPSCLFTTHDWAMKEAASLDETSLEYQWLSWDPLHKSVVGIINQVNIMKTQAASLPFTPVFAALVAINNTKLPPSQRVGVDEDY